MGLEKQARRMISRFDSTGKFEMGWFIDPWYIYREGSSIRWYADRQRYANVVSPGIERL